MSAASVPTDRLIGQILAQRYEILHRLGEGAMGVVYKARHVRVGRAFAVKVLHARLPSDPKLARRFEREAELAGRMRHPNVVGVVDVGEVEDMHYMVMDFAEGPDLAQLLVEAPMRPARIIALVRPMLEGLYHAHEHGLIHRDFKPENVIIERDSHGGEMPRIVDFGIALLREGGDASDGQGRLTTNGLVLGTPHYMAPEQAVADPIDHRIDLFALGIVIYEMLSGRLPFDGSGAEVARANLLLDPPPIVKRVPYLEVDPLLEAFARCLMAKRRDNRPATAHAARELLDLIERDRPAAAKVLGVASELSERAPAMTQPVVRHEREVAVGERTVTMRATPPSQPRADHGGAPRLASVPRGRTADPDSGAVQRAGVPTSEVAVASRHLMPVWTAPPSGLPPHGQLQTMSVPPIVFSAPAWGPPRGPGGPDRETMTRTPLDWPTTAPPRPRVGWILGGAALGGAGIVTAWMLTHGAAHDQRREPHIELSAITPAPEVPNEPPAPTPVAPTPVAPTPVAPTPVASTESQAAHGVVNKRVAVREPRPRPPTAPSDGSGPITQPDRHANVALPSVVTAPAAAPARPVDPGRPDVKTSAPAPAQAFVKSVERKPAKPAPCDTSAPSVSGIEPSAISTLYYKVAKGINQLPRDQTADLWARFSRFSVNVVMAAPQAERDAAAVALWQIDKDAGCRRTR